MRKLFFLASGLIFVVGVGSLALTLYLWFGDWPQSTRELVDHYRSIGERDTHDTDPVVAHVSGRRSTNLGGTWQALIDPYGRGDLGGVAARAVEPGSPSDLSEFSFENGLTLEVPGDWNTQDPRLVFYQGVVWYKRSFVHEPGSAERTFLWLGAVNYDASVYLNGRLLGRHLGGFTPFNFEVTDRLRPGENLLVIRVDNRKGPDDVPTPTTDWLNYGGITREVLLLDLPKIFIRDFELRLVAERSDLLEGVVELSGATEGVEVLLRIPELGIAERISTDAEGRARIELVATPDLWSPKSPRLYRVILEAGEDRLEDEIGFRHVAVRGSEILLNGEPIFLRGISIHEEAGFGAGRGYSREDAARLLGWARELGCNFVRLAHYPHSEHTVRLADRLGLLVWEEIPVYWTIDFGNSRTLERARRQLGELIERDRNRASVILWSIGNETPPGEQRQVFMTALAEYVRASDPSRLVTAALLPDGGAMAEFMLYAYLPALLGFDREEWFYRVSDPLAEVVDVAALNEYFGWYYSGVVGALTPFTSHHARAVMLEAMDRIRLSTKLPKPLIVSEFGAGAKAGMHAPLESLTVFSEEYQAEVYRRQLAMLEHQPTLAGMSPWILKDFRSPLRLYQGVQDYWNLKGLLADDGTPKLAFDVLRDYYRERRETSD